MRAHDLAVQLLQVDDAAFTASLAELHRLGQTSGVEVRRDGHAEADRLEPERWSQVGRVGP